MCLESMEMRRRNCACMFILQKQVGHIIDRPLTVYDGLQFYLCSGQELSSATPVSEASALRINMTAILHL